MPNSKRLKIHTKHRSRTYDSITVPEIRLEGKWLEKLGFTQNSEVKISMQHRKLIITPITSNKD